MIKTSCRHCGLDFETHPYRAETVRFCSWKCHNKARIKPESERVALFEERCLPVPWSGCWLWIGSISEKSGYGVFRIGLHRNIGAHVFSYEKYKGKVPDGLVIDHLCRVRCCVNPDHLEAVTQRVNNERSSSPSALNAAKLYCKNGHPFSAENTYLQPGRVHRTCRICRKQRAQKRVEASA